MQPSRGALLAITLGDPAGVGPEVALRAARALRAPAPPRLVLIGDLEATRETAARLRLGVTVEPCTLAEVERAAGAARPGRKLVLPLLAPDPALARALRPGERRPGVPSVAGARVAYASIRRAVELASARVVGAICTAPINKEWFDRAGVASTGHTELLAELTGARARPHDDGGSRLRVVLVTTHLALARRARRAHRRRRARHDHGRRAPPRALVRHRAAAHRGRRR